MSKCMFCKNEATTQTNTGKSVCKSCADLLVKDEKVDELTDLMLVALDPKKSVASGGSNATP